MKTNGKTKAMIRLLVMVVLAVNAALTVAGKNPIPFEETTFTEVATQVAAGLSVDLGLVEKQQHDRRSLHSSGTAGYHQRQDYEQP